MNIFVADSDSVTKVISDDEQAAVLQMHSINPENCGKNCAACPNADDGCAASTECAVPTTYH